MNTPDALAIRELIATWLRATHEGDVDTVLGLMAPDVVFLAAGQAPMVGREAFAKGLRNLLRDHAIESAGTVEEVVVEGSMAYTRTSLAVTVSTLHGHTPVRRSGHTLSVWRKGSDGKWLLTRDANLLSAT
ncbi:MAG: SgcJ/EcaC family oxidoreductase [Pseudomonadota bacterium]